MAEPESEPGSGTLPPPWRVLELRGDGAGAQACTHGLAALYRPEIRVLLEESPGSGPAAGDGLLELAHLAVDLLLADRLRPGDRLEQPLPDGRLATLASAPPAAPASLAAPTLVTSGLLASDTPVVTLRFHAQARAAEPRPAVPDAGPGGHVVPARVRTRIHELRAADDAQLAALLRHAALADNAGSGPLHARVAATAWARRTDREHGLVALRIAAGHACDRLLGSSRSTPAWDRVCMPWLDGLPRSRRQALRAHLELLVRESVHALVLCEALADVAPARLTVLGTGPWAWARSGGRAPGPRWRAPRWAIEAAREVLAPVAVSQIVRAGQALEQAQADSTHVRARDVLLGLLMTSAGACWPGCRVEPRLSVLRPSALDSATSAVVLLVAALALGRRLGPAWHPLTGPLGSELPLPTTPPEPPDALPDPWVVSRR